MAVGSRQILFADAAVPAAPRDDVREVANLSDNTQAEASTPAPAPEVAPGDAGANLDMQA